jgi:hypothetical protein
MLIPLAVLFACGSDNSVVHKKDNTPEVLDGSIRGRVCDPSGRTWLPDAMAYINLLDSEGQVHETRIAYTDLDGYWEIGDLPGDTEYTWHVQYGPEELVSDTVWLDSGEELELEEPDCFDPLALDVAVVTGDYDDFDLLLDEMGFANYVLINGQDQDDIQDFLGNAEELARYDIIFFNGGFVEEDVIYDEDNPNNEEVLARIANLQTFVEEGGSVYASDWAYDLVEVGWSDAVTFAGTDLIRDDAQMGDYGSCNAAVSDTSLAEFLGEDYIQIEYDLPVWAPITDVEDNVTKHIIGSGLSYSDGMSEFPLNGVPLLVSFNSGQGKVVYSTFRVARNASDDMVATLQYMMYSL